MKILVACEESQAVTIELRRLGHEAYSCDIEPCSGGHPEWHIQRDVLPLLNGRCKFVTMDGVEHEVAERWDMLFAFPPCTYLTLAGNKWFKPEYKDRFPTRNQDREEAVEFFMKFVNANCDKIAIENPIGIMSTRYRKPDQITSPHKHGHSEKKPTCFWYKNLKPIKDGILMEPEIVECKSGAREPKWHMETMRLPAHERSKARSKTFHGIAVAMAEQLAGRAGGQP